MVSAGLDNDKLKANKIHNDLFGLYHFLYSEGNPSGIKALLSLMDLCENNLRLPLVPISNSLHNEFKQYINGLH